MVHFELIVMEFKHADPKESGHSLVSSLPEPPPPLGSELGSEPEYDRKETALLPEYDRKETALLPEYDRKETALLPEYDRKETALLRCTHCPSARKNQTFIQTIQRMCTYELAIQHLIKCPHER
jgi:hypothetical protein